MIGQAPLKLVEIPFLPDFAAPQEIFREEKDPPPFDLSETPRIPQLLDSCTFRCATGSGYKSLVCGQCNRCIVETKLSLFIQWMQELNPTWRHEITMCFLDNLNAKSKRVFVDVLKQEVNPHPLATEEINKLLLADDNMGGGVVLPNNTPFEDIHKFMTTLEDTIRWFQTLDGINQQLFLFRCMSIQTFPAVLRICQELENFLREHEPPETMPHPLPVKSKKVVSAKSKLLAELPPDPLIVSPVRPEPLLGEPNPDYMGHTFVDLEELGIVDLEERNVFCTAFVTSRILKSDGSPPVSAICKELVAIFIRPASTVNILDRMYNIVGSPLTRVTLN